MLMIRGLLDDPTTAALLKSLQGTRHEQEALAGNLANAETPGYRAVRVSFQETLSRALRAPQSRRSETIARVQPQWELSAAPALRRDGNNVDVQQEMVALAQSGLRHRALTQLLAKRFAALREVVQGGRR